MIMSIGSGMVRPLHQMGLMVNFQSSYGEYAASIHKNVAALTQQEKAESGCGPSCGQVRESSGPTRPLSLQRPARCSLFPGTPTN